MAPKHVSKSNNKILAVLFLPVFAASVCAFCGLAHASSSDLLARGAYLARITGCIGCHTPRTRAGGVSEDRLLSGGDHTIAGDLGRVYPPNITPDKETGLGAWQLADIVKALKTGTTPEGHVLSTAMPWRTQYDQLSDSDALAIAAYLKSLPPIRNSVPIVHTTPKL